MFDGFHIPSVFDVNGYDTKKAMVSWCRHAEVGLEGQESKVRPEMRRFWMMVTFTGN